MILTTSEAADELRVSPFAVRKMVQRGELAPMNPGRRPLRFALLEVMDAQARRIAPDERARLDALTERFLALEP